MDTVLTVGRYNLDEWLASGEMGVVFRGYDPVLDRPVAIKVLRRELAKGRAAAGWRERFKRKARAGGRLFHPCIVVTLDSGEDQEVPFIAMEYVSGSRLDRLLQTSGRLPRERAEAITLQMLDALKYAHENGVGHLDLKPSIVFVQANDRVKVADFGVPLEDAAEAAAIGEALATTPSMSPEQLAGAPLDHRTDLFAAGALLFEMLTGAKPFRGVGADEMIRGPDDLCALNPELPEALRGVVNRSLAYHPAERFATADEFSRALLEVSLGARPQAAIGSSPGTAGVDYRFRPDQEGRGWDPEMLRHVEADLAARIGPVAAIAVRRAARRARDLVVLYEDLALHIENDRDREEFLASGRRLAGASSAEAALSDGGSAEDWIAGERTRAEPPDPAVLEAIEAQLVQYVGPIARILLKQQVQNFRNFSELYRNLSEHISDEAERAAFLEFEKGLTKTVSPDGARRPGVVG